MRHDLFVSVIIPLEDDLDILPGLMSDIDAVMRANFGNYELIFVDDGSTDGTRSHFEAAKARIANFRYFRLTRTFGFEIAIACGLEQAIGDVIVVLNPATDPPALIPQFATQANDTDGIVVGVRSDRKALPFAYRAAYSLYFAMCRIFLERAQVHGATHFIGLTRTALNALLKIKDSFRYIRVLAMYAGFAVTTVSYEFENRRTPPRERALLPLIGSAGNLIVYNSDRPLYVAAILSALIGLADFLFIFYVLGTRFFRSDIEPGWASTNIFNAAMFGMLFMVSSIICQYIAQIRSEIKSRPLYVVQTEMHSNVMPGGETARNVVSHEERAEALAVK
ncbi:MAG: glycosyltransferase [Rhodomicrobiaceae bacterium]